MRSIVGPALIFILLFASTAKSAPEDPSIAINFAAAIQQAAVQGPAGVLQTSLWNNLLGPNGEGNLLGNLGDDQFDTNVRIRWDFPNQRRSVGIVDGINNKNDQALVTGHLAPPGEITITGLGERFKEGYEVYVYTYGSRPDEAPSYELTTPQGVSVALRAETTDQFIGEFIEGDNFLHFEDLIGDQFILNGFGAINGIEIIASTTVPCFGNDLNGDGVVDVKDIDALTAAIKAGKYTICFDLNNDGSVDEDDCAEWIKEQNICPGDANMDGVFDSTDLVEVFASGEYEDGVPCNSSWADGDWNCDGEFNSSDLVVAFQAGWYNAGMIPQGNLQLVAASVPEPEAHFLVIPLLIGIYWRRCQQKR